MSILEWVLILYLLMGTLLSYITTKFASISGFVLLIIKSWGMKNQHSVQNTSAISMLERFILWIISMFIGSSQIFKVCGKIAFFHLLHRKDLIHVQIGIWWGILVWASVLVMGLNWVPRWSTMVIKTIMDVNAFCY